MIIDNMSDSEELFCQTRQIFPDILSYGRKIQRPMVEKGPDNMEINLT